MNSVNFIYLRSFQTTFCHLMDGAEFYVFNVFHGHENAAIQKRAKNPLSSRERELGIFNDITYRKPMLNQ